MESHQQNVINGLDEFPDYKETLFNYGFILKKGPVEINAHFPFYSNWEVQFVGGYRLYYHFKQSVFKYDADRFSVVMLGHAYNPFDEQIDENFLLRKLGDAYRQSLEDFIGYLNQLTGIFAVFIVEGEAVWSFVDYSAFQPVHYGVSENGDAFFYSHTLLADEVEDLAVNDYVARLKAYRFYPLYGEGLPYDITEYDGLLKVLPNTYVVYDGTGFSKHRCHPKEALQMATSAAQYEDCISECSRILQTTMRLIADKFPDPAISLTGGTDSKTTMAATNGIYDKFKYFSYNSQLAELVDCEAAQKICKNLAEQGEKTNHVQHDIPINAQEYPEYELVRSILFINGNRVKVNHNDIMKRIYFFKNRPFETEVKSWVSEVGRAFVYKKYGLHRLPKKAKVKHLTLISRIFCCNRRLYHQTNRINQRYIDELGLNDQVFNYDWSDIFFIEHRYGRWGSGVISNEHKFAYDITIPFNNRILGDLLMSVPLDKRIKDQTNFDMIRYLDRRIDDMNIHVVNYHHDRKRMLIDRAYFVLNSILPF